MSHITVLLHEVIDGLALHDNAVVLDCTINGGGHSEAIAVALKGSVRIIGLDADAGAIGRARERLSHYGARVDLVQKNFRKLDEALRECGLTSVDAILFDLGFSSNQLEESGRGFSFQKDEPLRMTFKENPSEEDLTARDVVNNWDQENIAEILRGFGGERYAERISRAIVAAREVRPIETTGDLVAIISGAAPRGRGKINPATKTFQALRIAVNDEVGALKEALPKAFAALRAGGRMAVISFHSLEDRIVKQFFRERENEGSAVRQTKKPIVAGREEVLGNPRARSAKLRILQKIG